MKLDRAAEARAEFERAAALTRNDRERTFLLRRAHEAAATSARFYLPPTSTPRPPDAGTAG